MGKSGVHLVRGPENRGHLRVSGVCHALNRTLLVLLTNEVMAMVMVMMMVMVMVMTIDSDEVKDNIVGDVVLQLRLTAYQSTNQPNNQ